MRQFYTGATQGYFSSLHLLYTRLQAPRALEQDRAEMFPKPWQGKDEKSCKDGSQKSLNLSKTLAAVLVRALRPSDPATRWAKCRRDSRAAGAAGDPASCVTVFGTSIGNTHRELKARLSKTDRMKPKPDKLWPSKPLLHRSGQTSDASPKALRPIRKPSAHLRRQHVIVSVDGTPAVHGPSRNP